MKALMTILVLGMIAISAKGAHAAKCEFELQNGRGKVLHTFTGFGYSQQDACQEAKKDCKQVKKAGYFRAPTQLCVKVKQKLTRSCTVEMINKRGKHIKFVTAHATGQQGNGIKAKACAKALKKCENQKIKLGKYGASCSSLYSTGLPQAPVIVLSNTYSNQQNGKKPRKK